MNGNDYKQCQYGIDEIRQNEKRCYKIMVRKLKKLTETQKSRSSINGWEELLDMEELKGCMFYEKWILDLKTTLNPIMDAPGFFYERLYEMYTNEMDPAMSFEDNSLLNLLREKIRLYCGANPIINFRNDQNDELKEKHRTWLFKYYKTFNKKPPLARDEWEEFFKSKDFIEVKYYPKTMDMIGTYAYTQDSYTPDLMRVIYDAYEFSEYSIEKIKKYGEKYQFLYDTIKRELGIKN